MAVFKFPTLNPLLHCDVRLKVMVVLDNLGSADFMYLRELTDATRGNLSVQLSTLKKAGYIEVKKTGFGRFSHTVCRITEKGKHALQVYEDGLNRLFTEAIPAMPEKKTQAV